MEAPQILYRVAPWGDKIMLENISVGDHRAWAVSVGFNTQLTLEAAVGMMRRNMSVLLTYQSRALRDGPAFVAPIKLEDVELLGGSDASTVSRILKGAAIQFEGERFDAGFLVSAKALDDPPLSGIQSRALCLMARAVLGEVSDQRVADALGRIGVPLARRTVNKYMKDGASAVTPTARFTEQIERLIACARDEAGLAEVASKMIAHSQTQLQRLGMSGDTAEQRRIDLRDWLLSSRILGAAKAQFAGLGPADQRHIVDAVLETLDARIREAQSHTAVRV